MARLSLLLLLACTPPETEPPDAPADPWCPGDAEAIEARIDEILPALTLDEKLEQLSGHGPGSDGIWQTAPLLRAELPALRMVDGPRGVGRYAGRATAFPVAMARGASWDVDLERRVGAAIGLEAAAKGANVILAPALNLLRHPLWGRAQETYGEDPDHLGAMASAFVRGSQEHVLASAKHFALNSIEDTRFEVDVLADERTLREVYLPHFREVVVAAHVASVMTAYNKVNGDWSSESTHLLRDILKGDWGFRGFVESDWVWGTRSPLALSAGLDLEMPNGVWFDGPLRDALTEGTVELASVDDAVRRLMRARMCHGLGESPAPSLDVVESEEHLALAREAATRSAVLLKNTGALPLTASTGVVLIGPLAEVDNIGDEGSSAVSPSDVVTLAEGLEVALDDLTIVPLPPWDDDQTALLSTADAVVLAVGLDKDSEGESLLGAGDRTSLGLPADQLDLIEVVAGMSSRTIVVLEGGSAIDVEPWIDDVDALLMAWYPGAQGGHAIADLLLGVSNPSGHLPQTWPRDVAHLPPFDPVSTTVRYDRWHGYQHLARTEQPARFPFGFGLSYTTFELTSIQTDRATASAGDEIIVTVEVSNTGSRAGRQLVQLYATPPHNDLDLPTRSLRGFAGVDLEAGASATVSIPLDLDELSHWSAGWQLLPGPWTLIAAHHAEDPGITSVLTVR